jgi:DNA-binding GntR family transcriptional regulator
MSSRSRVIADVLTKAILEHRLVPGAKLGERELSEVFEVSRIVVRQALIRLADDGLVSIVRNRGAFVAKPSMQEAYELYDALTLIEQGVAAQLAERMGPRDWPALRRQVEQTRQAMDSGNHALADTLGPDFHTQLIRASRNKVVQDIHAQIVRRTMLLRSLYFNHFDYCRLLDDHSKLLDLLEKKRVKQAMDLLDAHYRSVVRGFVMDDSVFPETSPLEALAPYLANGRLTANAVSPAVRNVDEDDVEATTAHRHLEEQIRQ